MRSSVLGLALLHGIAMLVVAWRYFGDAGLSENQESYGRSLLALAGCLMLIGVCLVPRTPALACVPFVLAGLLTLSLRSMDHMYLMVYGGWSIVLAALAVATGRWPRWSPAFAMRSPARTVSWAEVEPDAMAEPAEVMRRVQRYRARPSRATVERIAASPGESGQSDGPAPAPEGAADHPA